MELKRRDAKDGSRLGAKSFASRDVQAFQYVYWDEQISPLVLVASKSEFRVGQFLEVQSPRRELMTATEFQELLVIGKTPPRK
jgi:hypothetical protein